MQPKKRKHKKEFRGKMRGVAWRGSDVTFGEYGLQALDRGWITGRQIEAARRTVARATKRKGKVWIQIFPHKPVTEKSSEVTRGAGKGEVAYYVAVVKPGRILMELGGLDEATSMESLRLAAQKFPIKTRVVKKR
ncbi:50S ribosomal protein L16 [Candidatus Dojkabacteria bacterium]|uniref:Large ribosomal subunit protein uL16 n=1 Tax=Candidatus Dojkabacteria bacterium TaxID=2099670 RepID=A0A955L088_9BACT|nr:50S ribosomal protein L16 [Candidatus Dojkabacteria bacterium]